MQVFQQTLQHVNFLQAESIVAPIIIATHHSDCLRVDRREHDLAIVRRVGGCSTPGLSFSALVDAAGRATWRLTTTALSLASASV